MNLRLTRNTWESLGREDPLWAILSFADKRGNRWDRDEFFATGEREVTEMIAYLAEHHPEQRFDRVLDFGCGVGRLSQPLADHFEQVTGVDIAMSMIELARRWNRRGDRVDYHAGDLQCFGDRSFDFVYSNITLQHMKPRHVRGYLREFARVLRPGGCALLQMTGERHDLAAARQGRWFRALDYCRYLVFSKPRLFWTRTVRRNPIMDMFGIPRDEMVSGLDAVSLRVIDVVDDDRGGPDWTSFRYCTVRD